MKDLASKILSKESVTQRVGLETIVEDTDVWSTTGESSMASQSSHPSQNVGSQIQHDTRVSHGELFWNKNICRPLREDFGEDR